MTYEQFLAEVKTLDVAVSTYLHSYRRGAAPQGDFITETWTTGGESGGSCWDDGTEDHHYSVPADHEPDFVDFDTILEHFVPEVSHLAYKRLVRELVNLSDYTVNEYYGNYYSMAEKWVDLKKMYELLSREKGSSILESS